MAFKDVFDRLIFEKKITKTEIAQELGIHKQSITNYLAGKGTPDYDMLVKIADYFNVSVDYLLGRAKPYPTNEDTLAHLAEPSVEYTTKSRAKQEVYEPGMEGLMKVIDSQNKRIENLMEEKITYKLKLEACEQNLTSLKNGDRAMAKS